MEVISTSRLFLEINNMDEKIEKIVIASARRYSRNSSEIDDLAQIGRIAVWNASQRKPDANLSYYGAVIKYAMINSKKKDGAQKRNPSGGLVSLNEELGEDGFTLEETIGVNDELKPESRDLLDLLKLELRRRYGRSYVRKIGMEQNPRKLIRRLVRNTIEEIAKIPKEEIPSRADYQFFIDHGLGRILWVFYKNSPFKAINDAYNGDFLRWEFNRVPAGFWRGKDGYENALIAVNWLLNKNEVGSKRTIDSITIADFEKEGLGGMIQQVFNSSPYLALKSKFHDLKPWEVRVVPKGFLNNLENCAVALDSYLIDNGVQLLHGLTPEETYDQGLRRFVSKDSLIEYGLYGLVARFGRSPQRLFSAFYPEQILPWTLAGSKDTWKEEPRKTAALAVRWLFDKYLMIPTEEIPSYASNKFFWRLGFSGILTNRNIGFNSSTYQAVNNAYPGVFSPFDFRRGKGRIKHKIDKDFRKIR